MTISYLLKGWKNYVSVYTKTQRIITLQLMKQLEEILPANRFVRVHKSYIVALDKVNAIERGRKFILKTTYNPNRQYLPGTFL